MNSVSQHKDEAFVPLRDRGASPFCDDHFSPGTLFDDWTVDPAEFEGIEGIDWPPPPPPPKDTSASGGPAGGEAPGGGAGAAAAPRLPRRGCRRNRADGEANSRSTSVLPPPSLIPAALSKSRVSLPSSLLSPLPAPAPVPASLPRPLPPIGPVATPASAEGATVAELLGKHQEDEVEEAAAAAVAVAASEVDEETPGARGTAAEFYSHAAIATNQDGAKFLNDYMIIQDIGRGAQGVVQLAYSASRNMPVAIKIVSRPKEPKYKLGRPAGGGGGAEAQWQSEIDVMKNLNHPSIVRLYEVINDPSSQKVFLVMQYVDRGPIAKLDAAGRCDRIMTPVAVARAAAQVADGLAYLHRRGVVHRDIKPENILCDSSGNAFLADFGVSEIFEASAPQAVDTAGFKGTPLFMAPEIFLREEDFAAHAGSPGGEGLRTAMAAVDPQALDVWALGVTLLTLLTGAVPFLSLAEIKESVWAGIEPRLPPTLPPAWRAVLLRMLAARPADRISARETLRLVREILTETGTAGTGSGEGDTSDGAPLVETVPSGVAREYALLLPQTVPPVEQRRLPPLRGRRPFAAGLSSGTAASASSAGVRLSPKADVPLAQLAPIKTGSLRSSHSQSNHSLEVAEEGRGGGSPGPSRRRSRMLLKALDEKINFE